MPPLAWDCLTYHLTFAALWIQKGSLLLFKAPDQIINCAHFPMNGEIFASWFLLPFHDDLLVKTINFPITLLGGISCYAIARELGLTRKEAGFAPALICFAPMIYVQITTQYVDSATFTFCSATVLFTLRYLLKRHIHDAIFAFIGVGILLGVKYNGIPVVGLIFIAISIKMMSHASQSGFLKKLSLILLGLLILCTLGGRQYILNTIEAGNPLYPLSVKVLDKEIFKGWDKMEQMEEWISEYEKEKGWDEFSLWEKEYRKFLYLSRTAGPKFYLFLILALISLFTRPREISKRNWYFLAIMWIVPSVLYFSDTSVAKRGQWIDASTRYLSPFLALFTIQGLVVIKKISKHFKRIDFFLVALVVWDLLYIGKTHMWEVAILYPFMALMVLLIIIIFNLVRERLKLFAPKEGTFLTTTGLSTLDGNITKKWITYALVFIFLVTGLYFLQSYRDNTRYRYYLKHLDLKVFKYNLNLVDCWEFLDQPDDKKIIAMTMGWQPPGAYWFFYPLLGRWLQNDIVYISAKHKWEVPTWLDHGLLRGDDFSIWLHNVKRKEVDYILVVKPWPIELTWMQQNKDKFQLLFTDRNCKIFKCTRART
jgi:hypothetical protein